MYALLHVVFFLFSAGTLLFGLSLWPRDMQNLKNAADSTHWPTAQATIKTGRVDIQTHHRKASSYETYQWLVTYDYKVGDKAYSGSRISYATAADHASENAVIVDNIRERFAVGSKHPVRYNPKNPADAVLIPGVVPEQAGLESYFWILGSILLLTTSALQMNNRPGLRSEGTAATLVIVAVIAFAFFARPFVVRMLVPPDTVIAALR